jgi:PAS domain S-box-containing protein
VRSFGESCGKSTCSLDGVLDLSPEGIVVFRALRHADGTLDDFALVYANAEGRNILGLEGGIDLGQRLPELYAGEGLRRRRAALAEALTSASPVEIEVPARATGDDRQVRVRIVRLDDATLMVFARDVTDERRREEAARLATQRLELALHGADLGLWDWNVGTGAVHFNERWAAMLGYGPDEIASTVDGWSALIHPEDVEPTWALVRAHLEGRTDIYESEHRLRAKDGSWRWILDRGRVVERDAAGKPVRATGTHLDITERKEAVLALQTTMRFVDSIVENVPVMLFVKDARDLRFVRWNRAAERITGIRGEEALGKSDADFFPPDIARFFNERDREVLDARGEEDIPREPIQTLDGERRWLHTRKIAIRDAEDRPAFLLGISEDITERLAAEAELAASEERFRTLAEHAPIGIFRADDEGRDFYRNAQAAQVLGIAQDAPAGAWAPALHPDDLGTVSESWFASVAAHAPFTAEYRVVRAGGEVRWAITRAVPISAGEQRRGYVGTIIDITTRKETERALIAARNEAERTARAKSEFLGNMSHELRTPMNGVLGMVELLLDSGLNDEQREFAEILKTSGESLLAILNDILDHAKLEAGGVTIEHIPFAPRDAVEDVLGLFAARAQSKGLEVVCHVDPAVPALIVADPLRVRQILSNLVGNSLKFTERGEIVVHVAPTEGPALRFEVRDTGIGIPQEAQARLFRPFEQADGSTTRRFGGTGLGLSISRRLVEVMGGRIGVVSAPGSGSCFWFELPARLPEALPAPEPALAGRVLVVHRSGTFRESMKGLLASWGLFAEGTPPDADLLAALRGAVAAEPRPDVIVLDGDADVAAGLEDILAVLGERTRLLLLATWNERLRAPSGGAAAVVPKPVRARGLREAIVRLLGEAAVPR